MGSPENMIRAQLEYIFKEVISHDVHGSFLKHFARAFINADPENVELLLLPAQVLVLKYDLVKHLPAHGDLTREPDSAPSRKFFSISPDRKSITCHVCGRTSYHPEDVRNEYCGNCHVFHRDRAAQAAAPKK